MRRFSIRRTGGRVWFLLLLAGLLAWTVLASGLDNGHLGTFHDDGLYLTSAQSLRDGRGYGLPGRPGVPPPKYPIGLAGTIGLALRLDPGPTSLDREIAIGRGVVIAGAWLFFLGAHAWLRRVGVGPGLACGIILATAFHHIVLIGGAITIFSDLPFAGVAYGLMARWAGRSKSGEAGSGRRALVDGLIAGYAVLLRTNGVTLAFASLIAARIGFRRRSSLLACLAGLVIAVVPATYYAGRHARVVPSNSYLLEMKSGWSSVGAGLRILGTNGLSTVVDFPARIVASPATYCNPIAKALDARPALFWVFRLAFTIVVGVGLVTLIRSTRRVDWPTWAHVLGTIAIFLIWPWNGIMDRYLLSLIPMVLLAFVRGLEAIGWAIRLRAEVRERIIAVVVALIVAGNVGVAARAAYLFHSNGRQWLGASHRASLDEALALIRARTEPDAVIAAVWPEMVYLQTGRTVVPLVEDEAFLVGRTGEITRLKLWMALAVDRPFYALIRGADEDQATPKVDLPQLEALAAEPGLTIEEVGRTADGRYRLSRVSPRASRDAAR